MPPRKKTEEPDSPAHSCGACSFCKPYDEEMAKEHVGVCYALPPLPVFDGEDVTPARPIVQFQEPACKLFEGRLHA